MKLFTQVALVSVLLTGLLEAAPQCLNFETIFIPGQQTREFVQGWRSISQCSCREAKTAVSSDAEAQAAGYVPNCEADGRKFSTKQTSTRRGRITEWCVDPITGNQLGYAKDQPETVKCEPQCLDWTSISIPNQDSRDLVIGWKSIGKCTCTEAVEALTRHPEAVAAWYSPSCDPNGKFSAKQTFTRTGKTQTTTREWCADKETGTQLDGAVTVRPGVAPHTC